MEYVWKAWRTVRRGEPRQWSRLAAVILLNAITTACPPKPPPVTEIEIVPSLVTVGTHPLNQTRFELEARLWTGPATSRRSITESPGYDLKWTVSQSWLKVVSHNGYRATLSIAPGTPPSTPAIVKVKAGGRSAESLITPGAVSNQDVLTARYRVGWAPPVAIVNGSDVTGEHCELRYSALVRTGSLGNVLGTCGGADASWGAAVLDAGHAMAMFPAAWTSSVDPVDASSFQVPIPARSLPVALGVVVAGSADFRIKVRNVALADIAAANSILAENRVGVKLTVEHIETVSTSDASPVGDCFTGDARTEVYKPGMLHVYYVNAMGGARGLSCAGTDARPQNAIYVGWDNHSPTTFVHEVGHALGLTLPGKGHSDLLSGFDATNVMTGGTSDLDPKGRHRLSVGQVFRMNADGASWLNWAKDGNGDLIRDPGAPRLACQCGETDPTGRCPRLVDDVARPSHGQGASFSWDCYDRLELPAIDGGKAVGLLAGRQWRASPYQCSVAPGEEKAHWGGRFLQFANLTRPGICPSWAAVFFDNHQPIFQKLVETQEVAWSDAAEQWPMDADVLAPVEVPVHVYYPSSASSALQGRVKSDIDDAGRVFGGGNWSGITLLFNLNNPGDPCLPPGANEISICYKPMTAPGQATLNGQVITISTTAEPYTLAHMLGQALGLSKVSSPPDAFAGNVMQPQSGDRGDHLTLGQMFHIHSFLTHHFSLPGGFPDCQMDPTNCPPLDADLSP